MKLHEFINICASRGFFAIAELLVEACVACMSEHKREALKAWTKRNSFRHVQGVLVKRPSFFVKSSATAKPFKAKYKQAK